MEWMNKEQCEKLLQETIEKIQKNGYAIQVRGTPISDGDHIGDCLSVDDKCKNDWCECNQKGA